MRWTVVDSPIGPLSVASDGSGVSGLRFGAVAAVSEPDSVLAIAENRDILHRLDAAFFRAAEARGGTMVKYQLEEPRLPSLKEVREMLGQAGLDVEGLQLIADAAVDLFLRMQEVGQGVESRLQAREQSALVSGVRRPPRVAPSDHGRRRVICAL